MLRLNQRHMTEGLSGGAALADVLHELRSGVNGRSLQPATALPTPLTDYGGMVYKQPAIIVQPNDAADVSKVFRLANKYGIRVSIRGAGHSCAGQSLCDGGITLLNKAEKASLRILNDDLVEVTARATWGQLSQALAQCGLVPRVLTSHPGVTLGGTLSAGGYGLQSVVYGGHIDQVERLLLIQPGGEAVWCSPSENPRLFAFSLGGLGQIGYIEKAVIRVRRMPDPVNWYLYTHRSVAELVSSMSWIEQGEAANLYGFSAIYLFGKQGLSLYGVEESHAAAFVQQLPHHLRYSPYRRVNEPPVFREDSATAVGRPPFCPAVDYVLPFTQLAEFLQQVNALWEANKLQMYTPYCLLHAICPGQSHLFPFAAHNMGQPNRMKYLVGIYPVIPADDPEVLTKVRKVLHQLLEACIAAGGRPYLYGWHELDVAMKQKLYGASYDEWQALCLELDPQGILTRSL